MNIWEFLKPRLTQFIDKTAFVSGAARFTYGQLIRAVETGGLTEGHSFLICEEKSKLMQAVSVLRCFCHNLVCVPIEFAYGQTYGDRIKSFLADKRDYPPATACIMFTSGSTGNPKGVALTHDNIVFNILAIDKYFHVRAEDSILIARPLMHTAVLVGELLYALYKGMTIHFYEEEFLPQRIVSYISVHKISVYCATPTLMSIIARYIKADSGLRAVVVSGECLSPKIAVKIADKLMGTAIYSVYGLTEASPRVCCLPPEMFLSHSGAVGFPLEGVSVRLVNSCGDLINGVGEGRLYVNSPGVMAGYLGEPEMTASKLKDGWLDTGDIAFRDESGCYYIRGRADNLIIRSGMNIYPEEVENILYQDPRVNEVVCYKEVSGLQGQLICVDIVGAFTDFEVSNLCKELLPAYMQPNKLRLVSEIFKGFSGKKKRNANT